MKPDWKDAPEWATCLAMDDDCVWYWYENQPHLKGSVWASEFGRYALASLSVSFLRETLEQRPEAGK